MSNARRDLESAIEEFRRAAVLHGEGTQNADSPKANAAYEKLVRAYRDLRAADSLGRLASLFRDDDRSVRLWAATAYLMVDERSAREVLDSLAAMDTGIQRLNAKTVLREWDAGRLKPFGLDN